MFDTDYDDTIPGAQRCALVITEAGVPVGRCENTGIHYDGEGKFWCNQHHDDSIDSYTEGK